MNLILKLSALEQFTVILQGTLYVPWSIHIILNIFLSFSLSHTLTDCSLHEAAIKEGLLTLLKNILYSYSNHERKQTKIIERSSVDDVSLLSPCLLCLQLLVLGNETVRRTLHSDTQFLLKLIKCNGQMFRQTDGRKDGWMDRQAYVNRFIMVVSF